GREGPHVRKLVLADPFNNGRRLACKFKLSGVERSRDERSFTDEKNEAGLGVDSQGSAGHQSLSGLGFERPDIERSILGLITPCHIKKMPAVWKERGPGVFCLSKRFIQLREV